MKTTFTIHFEVNGGVEKKECDKLLSHHHYLGIQYSPLNKSIKGIAPRVPADNLNHAIDIVTKDLANIYPEARHIHISTGSL